MKITTISTEWELDNTIKLTLYVFIKLQKHLSELRIQLDKNVAVFKSSLPPTSAIIHKIFETNFSFHVKHSSLRENYFLFSKIFLPVLTWH